VQDAVSAISRPIAAAAPQPYSLPIALDALSAYILTNNSSTSTNSNNISPGNISSANVRGAQNILDLQRVGCIRKLFEVSF